jgi:hypothetical protein
MPIGNPAQQHMAWHQQMMMMRMMQVSYAGTWGRRGGEGLSLVRERAQVRSLSISLFLCIYLALSPARALSRSLFISLSRSLCLSQSLTLHVLPLASPLLSRCSLDQMQQQPMGMNGMGMLPNMRPPGMPMLGVEPGAASAAGPDGPQQQLMLQQQAYMMQQQQAYCNMMMHAQQQQMPQAQESMQAAALDQGQEQPQGQQQAQEQALAQSPTADKFFVEGVFRESDIIQNRHAMPSANGQPELNQLPDLLRKLADSPSQSEMSSYSTNACRFMHVWVSHAHKALCAYACRRQ